MTRVVIPLKSLEEAKSRLVPALSPRSRRELAISMAAHVIAATIRTAAVNGVVVVTTDRTLAALARARGVEVIQSRADTGMNEAVRIGLDWAGRSENRLVLPGDLPLLSADAINELIGRASRRRPSIAPDAAGTGTNALFIPAGWRMRTRFGDDSMSAHLAEGARALWRKAPTPFIDVDAPDDLILTRRCLRLRSMR